MRLKKHGNLDWLLDLEKKKKKQYGTFLRQFRKSKYGLYTRRDYWIYVKFLVSGKGIVDLRMSGSLKKKNEYLKVKYHNVCNLLSNGWEENWVYR